MSIITFLTSLFVIFFTVFLFVIPVIQNRPLPLRDMMITGTIIVLLLLMYFALAYAKAQGKLDVIESYCGKTVSPLSLIFYPEIEDKVILDCENRLAPPPQ